MNNWRKRNDELFLRAWSVERTKGIWRHVWLWLKVWGGLLFFSGTAYSVYLNGPSVLRPLPLLINFVAMGLLGGITGLLMWFAGERKFRKRMAGQAGN